MDQLHDIETSILNLKQRVYVIETSISELEKKVHNMEIDVSNSKLIISAIRWVVVTFFGSGLSILTAYFVESLK